MHRLRQLIKSGLLRSGYSVSRRLLPDNEDPFSPERLPLHGSEDVDVKERQILNLLRYAQRRETAYCAEGYPAGYHTLYFRGKNVPGQRDPLKRLETVPYEFKDKVALDLGCNQGGMLFALSNELHSGIGVDHDYRLINAANRMSVLEEIQHVNFFVFDLEEERLERLRDFLPNGRADIVFLLSVCMWIKTWRDVIAFARQTAPALLFETNGSAKQQAEQEECIGLFYNRVELLAERSEDDLKQKKRRMYLCQA